MSGFEFACGIVWMDMKSRWFLNNYSPGSFVAVAFLSAVAACRSRRGVTAGNLKISAAWARATPERSAGRWWLSDDHQYRRRRIVDRRLLRMLHTFESTK